ncbi:hypothetical protein LCGC14_3051260, partial [marine sediment metagenome]
VPAIGLIKNLKKPSEEKGQLIGTVVFDESGNDPLALMVASKVRLGILSKGSVGFRVKMIEILEDQRDGTRLIHRKMELMEFSIVNIPANPAAQIQRQLDSQMMAANISEHYTQELFQDGEGRETSASETSNLEELFQHIPDEGKFNLERLFNGN